MTPAPGERLRRFVGDSIQFRLKDRDGRRVEKGWRALLRTNLGRAEVLRREIIQAHARGLPPAGAAWRDLPMKQDGEGWSLELPLAEVGYFKAKAYLVDARGWQHWPEGPDMGLSVHPDSCRTANIVYCAFTRLFGPGKAGRSARDEKLEPVLTALDEDGYTVVPPSGKLRDVTAQLPHIFGTLGCRILHLLPVNPVPTTYARFGRFGSPYAALDLAAIDPALVVFDQRTTGLDQFRELTYAAHLRGVRVFLDIVINHTGWGSVLQEKHPEWFVRQPEGRFASPGVWNATWEDLVELKHQNVALWDELAGIFLTWCQRGVDGFRCDAGYKVPVAAWQYIVACVQQEYPETVFLLEGLGGPWEATDALLTEGGLHWAYSELFQNHSGREVAAYLDYTFKQSERVGLFVHYSETHDNDRLAARGRDWSLLRNRLSALASVNGGFGFTSGVEWLATERIQVHGSTGLAWDNTDNLVSELASLNRVLAEHPCFFDGARIRRLSAVDSPVFTLRRESEEGKDVVLVLVNTDVERRHILPIADCQLPIADSGPGSGPSTETWVDLLGQTGPETTSDKHGRGVLVLAPGAVYCLAPTAVPRGLHGDEYRRKRMQAAWGLKALARLLPPRAVPVYPWRDLAGLVEQSPERFLAAVSALAEEWIKGDGHEPFLARFDSLEALAEAARADRFPTVVRWSLPDRRHVTLVPPGHWLLIEDTARFRAALRSQEGSPIQNVESIPVAERHVACFGPPQTAAEAQLDVERYAETDQQVRAAIRFLSREPVPGQSTVRHLQQSLRPADLVLLTNGRGGMARLCVDLGRIVSKYDCVLGANLHPTLPVDRHVLAKRIRVWVNADGFISPLDFRNLASFQAGPPAIWDFVANAGDARTVEIEMTADMLESRNTTVFQFSRPTAARAAGKQLPAQAEVRLTVRVDIEDRNFHSETKRNPGSEHHFSTHCHPLEGGARREAGVGAPAPETCFTGFAFTPASDRQLRVFSPERFRGGGYHPQPEWSENIPHPVEQSRGQTGSGDAFSPGWFELPLPKGARVTLVVTAEPSGGGEEEIQGPMLPERGRGRPRSDGDRFEQKLVRAARAFLVRRGDGATVVAGYPWFLDWGRDTFICGRGLLAGGMTEEVKQLVLTFARFEQSGTLPNAIRGEDASNRDTADAPLWFALLCEELAGLERHGGPTRPTSQTSLYDLSVDNSGRTLRDVLQSIAHYYRNGTSNGIRMDPASALIWSPSHFTWMDTNYPACTPREGYPIEIQALWIRLLRQRERLGSPAEAKEWDELATQALGSLEGLFWREEDGYYADVLLAGAGRAASEAVVDDALRSNCLLALSLGLAKGERARRCVAAAQRYLVVPGALRSLAPLRVRVPLPIYGRDGRPLNDPGAPYWGRYEGDEDTRRKPAYHNGTAWTWTFPVFCEALARAWEFAPAAVAAAKAYLGSMERVLAEGCLGQLPEIVDGDAPHAQRGCDAQAWGVTEALRVWRLLN